MTRFEDSINELVENEKNKEAQAILEDLALLYEQFHALSRRLIYLISGEQKSRTGLTDFIKAAFHARGALCQTYLMKEVTENFDPTITSKAVSDSLQYLMKTKYLERYWCTEIKRYKYRVPRLKRK